MSREQGEADLALRIAAGQREAETEVCRRMAPRIRLYGLRHLRSPAAADDLVQQVLITLLQALRAGRLRDSSKLAPFVMGTCRMTVLDMRRTARRQEQLLAEFGPELIPAPPPVPYVESERLGRCVQALKERERTVVVLTFFDDQTSKEAAASLGLSEANVRVIRHRAIKQLHSCLGVSS